MSLVYLGVVLNIALLLLFKFVRLPSFESLSNDIGSISFIGEKIGIPL